MSYVFLKTAHTIAMEIISFSVGSTSNIPEVDGDPKCQESSLGPNVTKLCVVDITVESERPVYFDTEFQNELMSRSNFNLVNVSISNALYLCGFV